MRRPIEDGLSLLAGAGIGMAMMYLFDPEVGSKRRQRIASSTAQAMDVARETTGQAIHTVSEGAKHLAAGAASKTADLSERAAWAARDLADRAAGAVSGTVSSASEDVSTRVGEHVSNLTHALHDRQRKWVNRASMALGRERDHNYVGQTVCALGSLALGAGILWAFDPRMGRSRRAWLRDKTMRSVHEIGDFFRVVGVHTANKLRGTVAETRSYMRSNAEEDDNKLSARVRSELGRVVQNVGDVRVIACDGYVTLEGEVDGAQISSIGNFVLGIRGVRGIDSRLSPRGQTNAPTTPVSTAM